MIEYCFLIDAIDPAVKNEWTAARVHFIADAPLVLNGRPTIFLRGAGENQAVDPEGFPDIVPLNGGAIKRGNMWVVSFTGTLLQRTYTPAYGIEPYYIISGYWYLNDTDLNGYGVQGNLVKDFLFNLVPGANDDFYKVDVVNVECN